MKHVRYSFIGIVLLMMNTGMHAYAQNNLPITDKDKTVIIEKAISLLSENYIFPERLKEVANFITSKLKASGYASFTNTPDFLEALNTDLERESNDHHLDISFGPQRVRQINLSRQNEKEGKQDTVSAEWLAQLKYENFRLRKVERLDGNIGYFQFLNFVPLAPAREAIMGAMSFIRSSAGLVIDLRENGGGYAETVNFLLSYFLMDSLQTGEWRYRKDNRIEKMYVPAGLTKDKIPANVPICILVSNKTSSAAESFAYIMQQFKRAIVIGEQTKGEGNPGQLFVINESLYMMIPTIESRNAVTGKGIDGIGVTPDIKIEPAKAYTRALLAIYSQLASTATIKEVKLLYEWQLPFLENELNPTPLSENIINAIVGKYEGNRQIIFENGHVFYINSKGTKTMLGYIGKGVFQDAGKKWLRLVMPYTDKPVNELTWVWDDGGTEKIKRIE